MTTQMNKSFDQFHHLQTEPQRFGLGTPSSSALQTSNDTTQVMIQPGQNNPTQFEVDRISVPWSWCSLVTAMMSMLCCFFFGFIATVMAILSYVDHSGKQFERSKAKRYVSYGFSIAAIAIGSIIAVIGIVILVNVTTKVEEVLINNGGN